MALWLSIRRVGVRADAQERGPVPPTRDDDEDKTDLDAAEDSPADESSQGSDGDSDCDEHGGSDCGEPLDGATSLIAMFGTGWLNSEVFNMLYKRAAERPVYLEKAQMTAVQTFKRALCKTRGNDAYEWNHRLATNLEQLAEVRRHRAEHHEMLSDDAAWKCLWKWMYNFRFTAEQRKLGYRQQRSICSTIVHRELGCQARAHEVIKFGAAGLAREVVAEGEEAVLNRFITYICRIEKEVDAKKLRGQDRDSSQKTWRGDAQERAKRNSKGPPLIRAITPAKGKGKGAKNKVTKRKHARWERRRDA